MADHGGALLTLVDPSGSLIEARTGSGFRLSFDSPELGARPAAAGPMEAQLAVLGACTAYDVVSILRKKRQVLTGYAVEVRGERAAEHPRVYTRIAIEHRVSGAVEAEAVRRSIELSATRYCPVSAMLSASVRIEHAYRLTDAAGVEHRALVVVTGPGSGPG